MTVVGAMLGFVCFCATFWIMASPRSALTRCVVPLPSSTFLPALPWEAPKLTITVCVTSLFSSVAGDAGGLGSPPGDESTVGSSGWSPDHSCHLCGASRSWERESKIVLCCGKGSWPRTGQGAICAVVSTKRQNFPETGSGDGINCCGDWGTCFPNEVSGSCLKTIATTKSLVVVSLLVLSKSHLIFHWQNWVWETNASELFGIQFWGWSPQLPASFSFLSCLTYVFW